ncbi:protein-tyrosine phosphatase family protein [Planotetraspora kaengkrachanensis]|uniref:Protein phosphatase n=1 Tax=Planotetraspora kaengkrachanensis TaxID=575193 RepID=A0A8J3PS28_9ACTN|nr:dual specificity protein phosphatase family protein [Planotetraspora kaengkrachanensis]GIG79817.1 protein phosphatase [Planotetraspora kaengkrachanensis]
MRIEGRGAPYADFPWNEIVPGLFMGGHHYRDSSGGLLPVVVGSEFDVVVSLYRRDGHGPAEAVVHRCCEIPDGPLTSRQLAEVVELGEFAAAAVREDRKVLVRCQAGYNRSGLVIVQALLTLGYSLDDAMFLVRNRRSKWALSNHLFVNYLTTGLGVAGLLVGLDD